MGPVFALDTPIGLRSYGAHVPAGWDGRRPLPVVMVLHGAGATAEWTLSETHWDRTADQEAFLAVLPDGTRADPSRPPNFRHNPQVWNDGSPRAGLGQTGVDDVAFLVGVLDDVQKRFATDGRAFVTGFSNGAGMTFRLAAERSDRLTALAPVAGHCWVERPQLTRALSTLYLIGTLDPLVPLNGGEIVSLWGKEREARPPVALTLRRWANALGCSPEPVATREGHAVVERYGVGRDGAELIAWYIEGLGHHWPGGRGQLSRRIAGPHPRGVKGNEIIWEFFRRQPH